MDIVNKSIESLLSAIETGTPPVPLVERLRQKTDEKTEIEKLISVEELNSSRMPSEDEIAFFLHQLKNSKADDLRSRKALISTFINAIYLYDDRLTLILTIDGETVNISDPLLNTIEDVTSSFLNSSGLPF